VLSDAAFDLEKRGYQTNYPQSPAAAGETV
jgi:hypothetical protein